MLVSTPTLILLRCCFLWSLGFFFLTDANKITNHPLVIMVGNAMRLDHLEFSKDDPLVGLLSFLLIMSGISDLPPISGDYIKHFGNLVPVRLAAFFVVTGLSYFVYVPNLSNALVFSYGFVEIMLNFWIYSNIREERNELAGDQMKNESS